MIDDSLYTISIFCPACHKKGAIGVKKDIISSSKSGITVVNVAKQIICNHSLVVYIDRNLVVRDCFTCDFKVKIPEIIFQEKDSHEMDVNFDVDIIKINLFPSLMIHVLKGLFFGKNIVLIMEQDFIFQEILKFFKYLLNNTFKIDIECINQNQYKKTKKIYKNSLVLRQLDVLRDNDKLITNKKLKIESLLVQHFYSEFDNERSLILIRDEIFKVYTLSNAVKGYIENLHLKKNDKIATIPIKNYLKESYKINIDTDYLNFLIEIVRKYFNIDVPIVYKNFMEFI